jgi:hypothetical protein
MEHEFKLGGAVMITCSGERGRIIGLAQYEESGPDALIRYRAADGRAVESWWKISAIQPDARV